MARCPPTPRDGDPAHQSGGGYEGERDYAAADSHADNQSSQGGGLSTGMTSDSSIATDTRRCGL